MYVKKRKSTLSTYNEKNHLHALMITDKILPPYHSPIYGPLVPNSLLFDLILFMFIYHIHIFIHIKHLTGIIQHILV